MTTFKEKRRFVRVDDCLNLHVELLGKSTEAPKTRSLQKNYGHRFSALENKLKLLTPRLTDNHPELMEVFNILNEKVNFLAEDFYHTQTRVGDGEMRNVSLSACGIGFPSCEIAEVGDHAWIEIELMPEMVKVASLVRIVGAHGSDEKADGYSENHPFYLRAEFVDINIDDEESLIQHVVRRQSQWLREQRKIREHGEDEA